VRLPPLNALRAFEAAARHDGFIGASDELNVTRGAISRQVKVLEEHLGVALFTRHAQGVRLTAAGRQLQPVLAEAFRSIASEAHRLRSDALVNVVMPRFSSGFFRAMFAMKEIWNGKKIHRRVPA
jgi:LysR family glycine cleavage system transcriptional activator